jgi:hypothetical protein
MPGKLAWYDLTPNPSPKERGLPDILRLHTNENRGEKRKQLNINRFEIIFRKATALR